MGRGAEPRLTPGNHNQTQVTDIKGATLAGAVAVVAEMAEVAVASRSRKIGAADAKLPQRLRRRRITLVSIALVALAATQPEPTAAVFPTTAVCAMVQARFSAACAAAVVYGNKITTLYGPERVSECSNCML
mmetsp:Transcript_63099/g.169181  ORF Transcript_63099/g.169181 Transcript_63099/m.169181 type:complete len:132 (+) Transcript_63099:152-547(+)